MWRLIFEEDPWEAYPLPPSGIKILLREELEAGRVLWYCEADERALRNFLAGLPPGLFSSVERLEEEGLISTLPCSGLKLKMALASLLFERFFL